MMSDINGWSFHRSRGKEHLYNLDKKKGTSAPQGNVGGR